MNNIFEQLNATSMNNEEKFFDIFGKYEDGIIKVLESQNKEKKEEAASVAAIEEYILSDMSESDKKNSYTLDIVGFKSQLSLLYDRIEKKEGINSVKLVLLAHLDSVLGAYAPYQQVAKLQNDCQQAIQSLSGDKGEVKSLEAVKKMKIFLDNDKDSPSEKLKNFSIEFEKNKPELVQSKILAAFVVGVEKILNVAVTLLNWTRGKDIKLPPVSFAVARKRDFIKTVEEKHIPSSPRTS